LSIWLLRVEVVEGVDVEVAEVLVDLEQALDFL
jgi:hypothetical protein